MPRQSSRSWACASVPVMRARWYTFMRKQVYTRRAHVAACHMRRHLETICFRRLRHMQLVKAACLFTSEVARVSSAKCMRPPLRRTSGLCSAKRTKPFPHHACRWHGTEDGWRSEAIANELLFGGPKGCGHCSLDVNARLHSGCRLLRLAPLAKQRTYRSFAGYHGAA